MCGAPRRFERLKSGGEDGAITPRRPRQSTRQIGLPPRVNRDRCGLRCRHESPNPSTPPSGRPDRPDGASARTARPRSVRDVAPAYQRGACRGSHFRPRRGTRGGWSARHALAAAASKVEGCRVVGGSSRRLRPMSSAGRCGRVESLPALLSGGRRARRRRETREIRTELPITASKLSRSISKRRLPACGRRGAARPANLRAGRRERSFGLASAPAGCRLFVERRG